LKGSFPRFPKRLCTCCSSAHSEAS